MKEFAVNYTKNGAHTLMEGGKLTIDQCVFSDIYNIEKGYILRTKVINNVNISNSVFENCQNVITAINLSGINKSIDNCVFFSSGTIKTTNSSKSTKLVFKNPKWEDHKTYLPSEKSPLLKENNGIGRIGLLKI